MYIDYLQMFRCDRVFLIMMIQCNDQVAAQQCNHKQLIRGYPQRQAKHASIVRFVKYQIACCMDQTLSF